MLGATRPYELIANALGDEMLTAENFRRDLTVEPISGG